MATRRYRKTQMKRKTRRNRKSRSSKRGGFLSALRTAAVPFGLFAAQKVYSSGKRRTGRRTRSNKRK